METEAQRDTKLPPTCEWKKLELNARSAPPRPTTPPPAAGAVCQAAGPKVSGVLPVISIGPAWWKQEEDYNNTVGICLDF